MEGMKTTRNLWLFGAAPFATDFGYVPTTTHMPIGELKMSNQKTVVTLALLCAMALASQPILPQAAQSAPSAGASSTASLDQDIKMLREDVQSARKTLTAENMNLTTDEAAKFWPIYDQYATEIAKIGDARVALIKDYAANYDTMTDDQANLFIQRAAAIDQQFTDARSKYVPIFEKAISAKKTALWYQIDRRLDLLINLQLAGSIPVVNTSN
jgi:hypothetical protein